MGEEIGETRCEATTEPWRVDQASNRADQSVLTAARVTRPDTSYRLTYCAPEQVNHYTVSGWHKQQTRRSSASLFMKVFLSLTKKKRISLDICDNLNGAKTF